MEELKEVVGLPIKAIRYAVLGGDPLPDLDSFAGDFHSFDLGFQLLTGEKRYTVLWLPRYEPGGLILEDFALPQSVDASQTIRWGRLVDQPVIDVNVAYRGGIVTALKLVFSTGSVVISTGRIVKLEEGFTMETMPDELVAVFSVELQSVFYSDLTWT